MLIERLKHGDTDAFRTLIEKQSTKVISTCFSFVHNTEDAEDIAQEAFLEVYNSIHQFRKDADINTWIYRICINKCLDFLRKQKRKKRTIDLRALFESKNNNVPTPQQEFEEKERQEILKDAITQLPENQQVAIILSQYDKLPNKQIATIMDTSESAVVSLLHRARENLRKHLENYFKKNL